MGIGSIVMTDEDILSVLDSHLFHILLYKLHHKLIGQAPFVFRFETDGYVADWFADSWVQLGLDLEALSSDLRIVGNDAVVGDYFCLVFSVGVCCAASERGTGYYFCYHCLLVLWIKLCARDARSGRALRRKGRRSTIRSGMTIRRASEWIIFVFSSLCGGE